jgi:hypothetical protein
MPGLAELVQRELARRQEGDGALPAFFYAVDDVADGMTNVTAAAKAIIADADAADRRGRMITVVPAIADAVSRALRAAYPRRMIIAKPVVESPYHFSARPETERYHAEVDAAVARAAERVAKLRASVPRASQPDMQQDSRGT